MRTLSLISGLLVLMMVAASCSSTPQKLADAATTNDVGQTSDVLQFIDLGRADVQPNVPADAGLVPPDEITFPAPPEVACGGDAGECQFPPSACADPGCDGSVLCLSWSWVVYYDNPTCVSGRCTYTNRYFQCSSSSFCSAGGCRFNGTTAAP
jgi:hypothetical protein